MEFLKYETKGEVEEESFFLKKPNLSEVANEIFEKEAFSKGDVVLIDNDETIHETIKNLFFGLDPLENLPEDSRIFLQECVEREITPAIVTNMPRANHYMNHTIPVFGYDHYFQRGILRNVEFPVSLCLGSLYKQTQKSLYEIANWSMYRGGGESRIAFVGNSYLDKGFAAGLERVLRKDLEFKNKFYFYKVPSIRSFRSL